MVVESQGQGAIALQPEKPEVGIQQVALELVTPLVGSSIVAIMLQLLEIPSLILSTR